MTFYINDAIKSIDYVVENVETFSIDDHTRVDLSEIKSVLIALEDIYTDWDKEVKEEDYPFDFTHYLESVPNTLAEYQEVLETF